MNGAYGSKTVWALVAAAAVAGGAAVITIAPILARNPLLLLAAPIVALLVVLAAANLRLLVVFILFGRGLLDPALNTTKIDVGGINAGAGAALNMIVIAALAMLLLRRRPDFVDRKPVIAWAVFLCISAAACLYAPVIRQGLKFELGLLSFFALFVMPFLLVETKKDRNFWIGCLLWSSLLPVLFAGADFARGGAYYAGAGSRIQGTFTHPNILAFYLTWVAALIFYVQKSGIFRIGPVPRAALWLYLCAVGILLLASKTRSAWVACWVMFFLYGLFCERKFLIYCLAIIPLSLLHPVIHDRFAEIFRQPGIGARENSFAWRVGLWQQCLPTIRDHLAFGNGLASFKTFSALLIGPGREGPAAHNSYLEVLFESGLVGLGAYAFVFIAVLQRLWGDFRRMVRPARAGTGITLALVAAYVIFSFSDNLLHYLAFNWYFWFFMGLVIKGNQLEFTAQTNPVSDHAASVSGGQRGQN